MRAAPGSVRRQMAQDQAIQSDTASGEGMERDDVCLLSVIAKNRDKDAFRELFERYKVRSYNLAFNLTHDRSLSEDALQEAMLALWQSPKLFDSNEDVQGWILGIVAHKSLSLIRARARSQKREERKINSESYEMRNSDTDTQGLIQSLREHIEKLPTLERQILTLRYTEGLPQDQIGKLLSIPQQTISRRILEALARLRGSLQSAGLIAVLPLVGMKVMSDAINSGQSVPPGLTERIVGSIAQAGVAIEAAQALAPHASKSVTFAAKMGIFALAAVAVGTAYFVVMQASNTSTPSRAYFKRVWDFNNPESARAHRVVAGEWTYFSNGGVNESGCMESADNINTLVEVNLNGFAKDVPLRVSFEWQMMKRTKNYHADVHWERHGSGYGVIAMNANYARQTSAWISNTMFVTPEFTCTYMQSQRILIRYAKKAADSKLVLELRGGPIRIDDLTISEIKPEEIPSIKEYVDAVEKIDPSLRNKGAVLPDVKPFREGEQVGVFFFGASE